MGLVTLDIRQESNRHTDAIDTITNYLGIGAPRHCTRGLEKPCPSRAEPE